MLKLNFKNAEVRDEGYGLEVNGKSLEDTISTALGTRIGGKSGYGSGLPKFKSNCCNVTVIIDPQPVTTHIKDDEAVYHSVEDLEEEKHNEFKEKSAETDPEE